MLSQDHNTGGNATCRESYNSFVENGSEDIQLLPNGKALITSVSLLLILYEHQSLAIVNKLEVKKITHKCIKIAIILQHSFIK